MALSSHPSPTLNYMVSLFVCSESCHPYTCVVKVSVSAVCGKQMQYLCIIIQAQAVLSESIQKEKIANLAPLPLQLGDISVTVYSNTCMCSVCERKKKKRVALVHPISVMVQIHLEPNHNRARQS